MNWKLIILALYMMLFTSVPAVACNENTKLQTKSACQKQSVNKRLLASRIFVPTQKGQIGTNKTRIAKLAAGRNNTSSPWKLLTSLYSEESATKLAVSFCSAKIERRSHRSKGSNCRKEPWRKLSELFSY